MGEKSNPIRIQRQRTMGWKMQPNGMQAASKLVLSKVVKRPQPRLDSRNSPTIVLGNLDVKLDFVGTVQRQYPPIGIKTGIYNVVEAHARDILAAIAAADLKQHCTFEVVSGKERLSHSKRSPSGDSRQQHKPDFAIVQPGREQLAPCHLLEHRPVSMEITACLVLREKACCQHAGDTPVAIHDLERLALRAVPQPLRATWRDVDHFKFQTARASATEGTSGLSEATALMCPLYVRCNAGLASRIGHQVELVVHSMANGNRGPFDHLFVSGASIVGPKRPFTVFVELERQAGYPATSGARAHALQANGFKFFDRLLGSVHSGLLGLANATTGTRFQQARAA